MDVLCHLSLSSVILIDSSTESPVHGYRLLIMYELCYTAEFNSQLETASIAEPLQNRQHAQKP